MVAAFAARAGIGAALAGALTARQCRAGYGRTIEAVVVNLVCGREPLYALARWGQDNQARAGLDDDRVGRALEALWQAGPVPVCARAAVDAARACGAALSEVHNDSTSIRLWGPRRGLDGSGGTARAARGHSKDHRPDLRQLVAILSVSADGTLPLVFRLADGNTEDSTTHIDSFDQLSAILGTTDFVYVADCKLATDKNMAHIANAGGVFVTALPAGRKDTMAFDAALASDHALRKHAPVVWAGPSRGAPGEIDQFRAVEAPLRTTAGHRMVAVFHADLARGQAATRAKWTAQAITGLQDLNKRAAAPKTKIKTRAAFEAQARAITARGHASRWIDLKPTEELTRIKRSYSRPGRPRPDTPWQETSTPYWQTSWSPNHETVKTAEALDGWFPLVTNSPTMTPAEVLNAYKRQPHIEKRFSQLKSGNITADPVRLQKPERVQGMVACWHLAMLVSALIEHMVTQAMTRADLKSLPIYPEQRPCPHPTTRQILRTWNSTTHWARDFILQALNHPHPTTHPQTP